MKTITLQSSESNEEEIIGDFLNSIQDFLNKNIINPDSIENSNNTFNNITVRLIADIKAKMLCLLVKLIDKSEKEADKEKLKKIFEEELAEVVITTVTKKEYKFITSRIHPIQNKDNILEIKMMISNFSEKYFLKKFPPLKPNR